MANLNELLIALQYNKNVDLQTPAGSPLYWRIANLNKKIWAQHAVNETDAGEVGSGDEFATQTIKSHYDNGVYTIERYCSPELLAFAHAFVLGNTVKSGTTPNWVYTSIPMVPATAATLEPPYLQMAQQMRPGGSSVFDQLFVGVAAKSFRIALRNQPGRASAMVSIDLVNSGVTTEPSAVAMPALVAFREMNAGTLSLTVNGVDLVADSTKPWVSLDMGFDNIFRPGWFPGAPSQDGYATQGRFEIGDRVPSFSMVKRFAHGSPELTLLRAQTTFTVVVGLTFDTNNNWTGTWQKMALAVAELGDANGIVTVQITGNPLKDATNGLYSSVTKVSGVANGSICQ